MQDNRHGHFFFASEMACHKGFDHRSGLVHACRFFICLRSGQMRQLEHKVGFMREVAQHLFRIGVAFLQYFQPRTKARVVCGQRQEVAAILSAMMAMQPLDQTAPGTMTHSAQRGADHVDFRCKPS